MTALLYHTDSYAREFDATVVTSDSSQLELDQTVFYTQSGGQPADHGIVRWVGGEARVLDVRRLDGRVRHSLDMPPPSVGTVVHGVLDWERRYALMRAHTALHILCGVIWRDFGAKVTGGSMEPGSARMDFELDGMSAGFAEDVEGRANAEITANREIRVRMLARDEAFAIPDLIRTKINLLPPDIEIVRVVEIIGLDMQADGGTHVARTGEVGRIRIVGHESKGRINKRLRLAL